MAKFKYESLSYVGRRKNNQDSCFAGEINEGFYFLTVADGMGGAAGGEIASQTVIATAMEVLGNASQSDIDPYMLKATLKKIFEKSQEALAVKIEQNTELTGMGTTLSCVLLLDDKYVCGNIGDSRIYLLTERNIHQLTNDHTYIQEHIDKHGDDIPEHFYKTYGHIITRSLNGENDKPDIFPTDADYSLINKGELLLLCSDGLISNKADKDNSDFHEIIIGNMDLLKTAKNLISYAYQKGSTDNITVVLGEYGDVKRKKLSLRKYGYPPIEIQSIEKPNITEESIPDNLEDVVGLEDGHSDINKTAKGNIPKVLLISIIFLILIGGGGYLFLANNNKESKKNIETKKTSEQEEIIAVDFSGFDNDKLPLKSTNDITSIVWSEYKGKGFEKYVISVADGNTYDFSEKKHTNTTIGSLGIKNNGEYTLSIKVKLINGIFVPGKPDLILVVN